MTAMLDTNILVYHLARTHEAHGDACNTLMRRVRVGEEDVFCPATAIMECTFVLEKGIGAPRSEIAALLGDIVQLRSVHCEYKHALLAALVLWERDRPLDFADCYHLTLAKELGMSHVYSFDRKMDRYPGVERIEPE